MIICTRGKIGMSKTHQRKLDKFTTVILLSCSKNGAKTLHIPKWIKYPLLLIFIISLASISTLAYNHISYVRQLEEEYSSSASKITSLSNTISDKNSEITTLQHTTQTQEQMLKQVNEQAEIVADKFEKLMNDTSAIGQRLDNSKKTTTTKPTGMIDVEKESTLANQDSKPRQLYSSSLQNPIENDLTQVDSFMDRSKEIYTRLIATEVKIAEHSNEVSQLNKQADILLPYWDAYPSGWPTNGRISSYYGWRKNPTGYGNEFHRGLDIKNYSGANVVATGAGVVVESRYNRSYGYLITIDHGYGLKTRYAHNKKNLVKVGDKVTRGSVIAHIGSTGNSTGPHVHYEVRIYNKTTNPKDYLN